MLLVFEERTDSTTRLKAIKKHFSDDVMLVTNKAVQTHAFEDKSVDIVQTTAGYIAYGRLTESNNVFI